MAKAVENDTFFGEIPMDPERFHACEKFAGEIGKAGDTLLENDIVQVYAIQHESVRYIKNNNDIQSGFQEAQKKRGIVSAKPLHMKWKIVEDC